MGSKFGRGQAISLPKGVAFSVPHIEKAGRTAAQIATTIYNKRLCWWNLDENGTPPLSVVNQAGPNYSYTFGGSANTLMNQATLRSGGLRSWQFTAAAAALLGPADHTSIIELVGAASFSCVAWCKLNNATTADYRTILDDGDNGTGGAGAGNSQYHFAILPDGRPTLYWQNGVNVNQDATANPLHVVPGTTYFFGVDKTVATRTINYFTNGVLAVSSVYPAGTEPTNGGSGSQQQAMGASYKLISGTPKSFDGYLQDVAIFKPALAADEHAFLYNGGVGRSWNEIKTLSGH